MWCDVYLRDQVLTVRSTVRSGVNPSLCIACDEDATALLTLDVAEELRNWLA